MRVASERGTWKTVIGAITFTCMAGPFTSPSRWECFGDRGDSTEHPTSIHSGLLKITSRFGRIRVGGSTSCRADEGPSLKQ